MILDEPKFEFVAVDFKVFTDAASFCTEAATEKTIGGGQRCTGTQPDAQGCINYETSIPW